MMSGRSLLSEHLERCHRMVEKATSHPIGRDTRIPDMKSHSWDNLGWFSKPSNVGRERLKSFLTSLDKSERVDPNSELRNTLLCGVTKMMKTICENIEELEPRFKGQLIPMGSSHNNTKIGQPDEFDFSYELNTATLLKEKGSFKALERDDTSFYLCVEVEGMKDDLDFYQFPQDQQLQELMSVNGSNSADYFRHAIGVRDNNYTLNTEHVAFAFYSCLQKALSGLQLLPGWSHGGFNRPNFSGIRFNLPSFMLQFVYDGTYDKRPISLSVDFVPVIQLERKQYGQPPDVLNSFLWENNYAQKIWHRLERGCFKTAFYSPAEERLLAEYSEESVPKMAIRLSKALQTLARLNSPKYPQRFLVETVVDFLKQREPSNSEVEALNLRMIDLLSISQHLWHMSPDNDFVTYNELNETNRHEYVTSYMLKRTVMTMLALDPTHGHDWTLDELPDLVMSIFMIINDMMIAVNQSMTIPTNEVLSEDGSSLTFTLAPRLDVMSGNYGNPDAPILVGEFSVPLQGTSCVSCTTELTSCSPKGKPAAELDRHEAGENVLKSTRYKTELPRFYSMLKSAITEEQCGDFVMLFLRSDISLPIKNVGLDVGISQVFQILQCVHEGQKTAKIAIYRSAPDDDEQDFYDNISKYLVTKEEFKNMLGKS